MVELIELGGVSASPVCPIALYFSWLASGDAVPANFPYACGHVPRKRVLGVSATPDDKRLILLPDRRS